ncbi:MAG: recombinase RecF, partial [Actinomycetota bacterium]
MADDRLKETVLARADRDGTLSEQARLVVLGALESPEDLADALGGAASRADTTARPIPTETPSDPVGAYLASVTVQGFRGIGP